MIFMIARDQLADMNPQYWYFWLGLMLIAVIVFLPNGILGGCAELLARWPQIVEDETTAIPESTAEYISHREARIAWGFGREITATHRGTMMWKYRSCVRSACHAFKKAVNDNGAPGGT